MNTFSRIQTAASAALLLMLAAACDRGASGPSSEPQWRTGEMAALASDSAGTPVTPPPSGATGAGYFQGIVRSSEGASGTDTLATSARIPGVVVTAYPVLSSSPSITTGDAVASVVTGSLGTFELPVLPAGEYVVAFDPPDNRYHAGWVLARAHSGSGEHAWWVTLSRRP